VSSSPFYRVRGGSGAAGQGRGLGGRWWRHQCRSSGLVGRGNGGVSGECGAVSGRGGDAGAVRVRAGPAGGQGPVGREAGGWA
jgi:hypothetical protein